MATSPSVDPRPSKKTTRLRGHRSASRIVRDLVYVSRKGFVAYLAIAFAVAWGFHIVEHRADERLQRHIYVNCVEQEAIKRQANQRIAILVAAQDAIQFTDATHKVKFQKVLHNVNPLPLVDCSRLKR